MVHPASKTSEKPHSTSSLLPAATGSSTTGHGQLVDQTARKALKLRASSAAAITLEPARATKSTNMKVEDIKNQSELEQFIRDHARPFSIKTACEITAKIYSLNSKGIDLTDNEKLKIKITESFNINFKIIFDNWKGISDFNFSNFVRYIADKNIGDPISRDHLTIAAQDRFFLTNCHFGNLSFIFQNIEKLKSDRFQCHVFLDALIQHFNEKLSDDIYDKNSNLTFKSLDAIVEYYKVQTLTTHTKTNKQKIAKLTQLILKFKDTHSADTPASLDQVSSLLNAYFFAETQDKDLLPLLELFLIRTEERALHQPKTIEKAELCINEILKRKIKIGFDELMIIRKFAEDNSSKFGEAKAFELIKNIDLRAIEPDVIASINESHYLLGYCEKLMRYADKEDFDLTPLLKGIEILTKNPRCSPDQMKFIPLCLHKVATFFAVKCEKKLQKLSSEELNAQLNTQISHENLLSVHVESILSNFKNYCKRNGIELEELEIFEKTQLAQIQSFFQICPIPFEFDLNLFKGQLTTSETQRDILRTLNTMKLNFKEEFIESVYFAYHSVDMFSMGLNDLQGHDLNVFIEFDGPTHFINDDINQKTNSTILRDQIYLRGELYRQKSLPIIKKMLEDRIKELEKSEPASSELENLKEQLKAKQIEIKATHTRNIHITISYIEWNKVRGAKEGNKVEFLNKFFYNCGIKLPK